MVKLTKTQNILLTLLGIPFILLGSLLSRMHGGGKHLGKIGDFIDRYSLEAFLLALPLIPILYFNGVTLLLSLFAYATAVIALRKGHGQYMTLPYSEKIINAEDIDIIPTLFFGEDPRVSKTGHVILEEAVLGDKIYEYGKKKLYWRNVFGMSISGLTVTLLSSILLLSEAFFTGAIILLLGGTAKSIAYVIGWKLKDNDEATELAEYLRGTFLFTSYAIVGWITWLF